MNLPAIEIRQTSAQLGMRAELGKQRIRQPRAEMKIETTPPQLEIRSPQGRMDIDQSRAWDALGFVNILESMHRIYDRAQQVALEGIGRIVEEGNRLAAIHDGSNAIADLARQEAFRFHEFDYFGPASYDNVDIFYKAQPVEFTVKRGDVNIQTTPRPPQHDYERGPLDIYMRRYADVEIIPPRIDLSI